MTLDSWHFAWIAPAGFGLVQLEQFLELRGGLLDRLDQRAFVVAQGPLARQRALVVLAEGRSRTVGRIR